MKGMSPLCFATYHNDYLGRYCVSSRTLSSSSDREAAHLHCYSPTRRCGHHHLACHDSPIFSICYSEVASFVVQLKLPSLNGLVSEQHC